MCEEWDDEVAEDFLIEYRRHECLWNPFHAAFADCYARTEALTRIVSALGDEINFKGCLRLIRAIREKYVREQTKALLSPGCHSEQSRSGWRRIVEAMLEKIVCDEERVEETSGRRQRIRQRPQQQQTTTTTKVKTLFRHTIASSARRKDAVDPEGAGDCTNNASLVRTVPLGKGKRKKRGRKKNRSKLENINRFCSDAEKTKERNSCKPSDCARPGTAWTRQRDSYLDNLTWTTGNCARTVECPAYTSHLDRLSRVENICKDPCTVGTGNYGCANRANQCSQRNSCGERKRSSDIQPTMPCESKSTRSRQSSAGSRRDRPAVVCPEAKKRSGEKCPTKTCDKMTECCPCPDKKKDKCQDRVDVGCEKEEPKPKTPESCTKDTCPSYQSRCAKADRALSPDKPCQAPVVTANPIHPSPLDQSRTVRFDGQNDLQSCTYAPRVAARFENGVLEAYSQFKVVFPSTGQISAPSEKKRRSSIATSSQLPEKSTRRVQTDKTTRDFAACVTDEEFRPRSSGRKRCCSAKCPSRRDIRVGTDEDDVVDCCQDDAGDMLEPGKTIHDFVLLTPGGKYVPLVRTRSESPEKVVFTECCVDGGSRSRQQRAPELCENASSRTREKQLQNVLDDEKCASSTTKLLLRCLEQMLNLEEQEEKGKPAETKDDQCEPCKRAKPRDLECDRQPTSGCLPCRTEKPTSGKLAQNFLEILRCALDLDNGKKEYDCDEEPQKQDCCECDAIVNKAERPTPENTGEFGLNKKRCGNDQSVQCNAFEEPCAAPKTTQTTPRGEGRMPPRRDFLSSTRFDHQNQPLPREIPVIRLNDCTVPPSVIESLRLPSSPVPNSQLDNRTPLLWKTSKRKVQEINKDGQYLRVDTISTLKEASTVGTSINPDVQDAGVQEKMPSSSIATQCETRTSCKSPKDTTKASVGTQKRDTVLEYLVRCAKRPELPATPQTTPRESTNLSHQHHHQLATSRSSRKSRADDMQQQQQQQQQQLCDDCQDGGVKYVKCNQVYRSFIVRSPTREGDDEEAGAQVRQQYHRRICALKKVYK